MVEDSFVSHIITEKYMKHVPLYRQEKVMNNLGLNVSRKNFSNWLMRAAEVLKPLFNLMYQYVISRNVCHMDETTLKVLHSEQNTSYIWGLCSSKYNLPVFLYFYKESREHKHAAEILQDFNGYVHSDGYRSYQKVEGATDVACFAHVRRKYVEIIKAIEKQLRIQMHRLTIYSHVKDETILTNYTR